MRSRASSIISRSASRRRSASSSATAAWVANPASICSSSGPKVGRAGRLTTHSTPRADSRWPSETIAAGPSAVASATSWETSIASRASVTTRGLPLRNTWPHNEVSTSNVRPWNRRASVPAVASMTILTANGTVAVGTAVLALPAFVIATFLLW
jgi:hypothetical protein